MSRVRRFCQDSCVSAITGVRDRDALALHPGDAAHAATLWTELVELA